MSQKKYYLYPKWIRFWHWLNALTFLILLITGLSIHFASADGGFIRFDIAVAMHNASAFVLIAAYGLYVLGNIVTGNGKYYRGLKDEVPGNLMKQAMFYISGMFKNEKHPFPINMERKFNPLQKISYVAVMYLCMPLIIISGLGLLFPETVIMQVFGVSGMVLTDYVHIIMAFCLSIFLLIHLYTCTLGDKPLTLFRSMFNGYHEEHE